MQLMGCKPACTPQCRLGALQQFAIDMLIDTGLSQTILSYGSYLSSGGSSFSTGGGPKNEKSELTIHWLQSTRFGVFEKAIFL